MFYKQNKRITYDKMKRVFKNQRLINRIFETETYLNSFMKFISVSHRFKIKRTFLKLTLMNCYQHIYLIKEKIF